MSSAWSSHLGMSGFLAEASAALARTRTRTRRGIVHLRTLARRELSFTLVVTRSTTREVDARSGGVQPTQSVGSPCSTMDRMRRRRGAVDSREADRCVLGRPLYA